MVWSSCFQISLLGMLTFVKAALVGNPKGTPTLQSSCNEHMKNDQKSFLTTNLANFRINHKLVRKFVNVFQDRTVDILGHLGTTPHEAFPACSLQKLRKLRKLQCFRLEMLQCLGSATEVTESKLSKLPKLSPSNTQHSPDIALVKIDRNWCRQIIAKCLADRP